MERRPMVCSRSSSASFLTDGRLCTTTPRLRSKTQIATSPGRGAGLNLAALSAGVDVDQRESRSFAAVVRFDGHVVLVVFSAHFQFGYRTTIVSIALQLFGSLRI